MADLQNDLKEKLKNELNDEFKNELKSESSKKFLSNETRMANRPIELKNKIRPTIEHQNKNLTDSPEPQQSSQSEDSQNQFNIKNQSNPIRNQSLNRFKNRQPIIEHENQNLNQPSEINNQNVNLSQSIESNNSNQSDIPPETTLFDQIAFQVHKYKGNLIYTQKLPGILNLLEILIGLLTFFMIFIACNNYYDPWHSIVVSGFAGGKVEVFFLLTCTYALITTSIFTILILVSNSYEATLNAGNFNFIITFTLFAFLMFSSVLLLIELSNRNTGILVFEHRFGIKVTCAVFGIINSLFYLLNSSILFKIPSSHDHPKKKQNLPQPI